MHARAKEKDAFSGSREKQEEQHKRARDDGQQRSSFNMALAVAYALSEKVRY